MGDQQAGLSPQIVLFQEPINTFQENVVNRLRVQGLEIDLWGLSPSFAIYKLCNLRQETFSTLCLRPQFPHL